MVECFNMQSILPDAWTLRNLVKKRGNLSTNFKCFINGFFEVIVPRDPDVRPNALTAGKKAATSASPPSSSASAAKFGWVEREKDENFVLPTREKLYPPTKKCAWGEAEQQRRKIAQSTMGQLTFFGLCSWKRVPGLLLSRHTQKLDFFENGRPVVGESRPYSIVILIRRFCIAFFLKRYAKKNWWTYFVKYFIIEALLLFGGTPTHQFLQRFLVHATGVSFRRKYSTPTRQLWKTMRENLHISEKKT